MICMNAPRYLVIPCVFKRVRPGGNPNAKKSSPSPFQVTLIYVVLPPSYTRTAVKPRYLEVFGEGSGERPFFKKILPGILL